MTSLLNSFNDIFWAKLVELVEQRALLGGVLGVGVGVVDEALEAAVGAPEGPPAHPIAGHDPVEEPPGRLHDGGREGHGPNPSLVHQVVQLVLGSGARFRRRGRRGRVGGLGGAGLGSVGGQCAEGER